MELAQHFSGTTAVGTDSSLLGGCPSQTAVTTMSPAWPDSPGRCECGQIHGDKIKCITTKDTLPCMDRLQEPSLALNLSHRSCPFLTQVWKPSFLSVSMSRDQKYGEVAARFHLKENSLLKNTMMCLH